MEVVSVAFGILFFLAIHFSIEAKDEKKLREKNEQKAEQERERNERKIEKNNKEIKMKDLISQIRNSENSLSLIESIDREENEDTYILGRFRFASMLEFNNDLLSKRIWINEYPYMDRLEIQVNLSKRRSTGSKKLDLRIEDCYNVNNSIIMTKYINIEAHPCYTPLK
mgnify:CR=1 FL=1